MIIIGRFINSICLNPLEYLLDGPDGEKMKFKTKADAKNFLREHGIRNEDTLEDCFTYKEV
jgi:hypothetical protein